MADNESSDEERFVTLGIDAARELLEGDAVRGSAMKDSYDFSKAKRGRVVVPPDDPGKTKITIRLDADVIQRFQALADKTGGVMRYQSMMNAALREYLDGSAPKMEDALRRIIREEFAAHQ